MFGMSRSGQTMTFMPLASVVVCTWSAPGTRTGGAGLVGLVAAPVAAATMSSKDVYTARATGIFGMQHLARCALYTQKKKSAAHGGSRLRRQEANTGEELFAVLCEAWPVRGITSKP